jgi:phospholipase C
VPLLIISPLVKGGHITHQQLEFSSVLKFIEERFVLAPLTERDEQAGDLSEDFDFFQHPIPPLILETRQCPGASADVKLDPRYHNGAR